MTTERVSALVSLRRYAADQPWSGSELVAFVNRLIERAGQGGGRRLSERTLHYYVAQRVIAPPFGRGAGAGWGYSHLIGLLAVRLRQADGQSLADIARQLDGSDLNRWEQDVAERLGRVEPPPEPEPDQASAPVRAAVGATEIQLAEGIVLRLAAGHWLQRDPTRLAELRAAVGAVLAQDSSR